MNMNLSYRTALLFLGLASCAAAQDLTPSEREHALRYLDQTRDGVVNSVKGLSEAQWKFKPAADRWSVAEVVEHLALIEDMVRGVLGNLDKGQNPAANRDVKQIDAMLLARVPDRSTKAQAPDVALPTGRWTPDDTLANFLASRAEVTAILQSARSLRAHVIAHPAFGPLDGYQWILAVAAHSERHTKQIMEVKADAHFPGTKISQGVAPHEIPANSDQRSAISRRRRNHILS